MSSPCHCVETGGHLPIALPETARRNRDPDAGRAALADGDHYREMAGNLRELARQTRSPGMRRELVDLARRYDRRGDHFDCRPR